MSSKEIVYQPLEICSDDSHSEVLLQHYTPSSERQTHWERLALILCIIALVISNGVWVGLRTSQKGAQAIAGYPKRVPYHFSTPYIDGNLTMTNQLWLNLFPPGRGAVKVDHKWAAENNLPPTQGDSSDGKAIYVVAAFHHLHCLNVIRTSLFQFNKGHGQKDDWSHVVHCIDAIRQQVQCLADPTLGGAGVEHDCRDFDALKAWTIEHAYTEYIDPLLNPWLA